jgi:hypothetical protein
MGNQPSQPAAIYARTAERPMQSQCIHSGLLTLLVLAHIAKPSTHRSNANSRIVSFRFASLGTTSASRCRMRMAAYGGTSVARQPFDNFEDKSARRRQPAPEQPTRHKHNPQRPSYR